MSTPLTLLALLLLVVAVLWVAAHENRHCAAIETTTAHERDHCAQIGELQTAVVDLATHLRGMSAEPLPASVEQLVQGMHSAD